METHPGESVRSYTINQRLASFISHEQSPNIIACRLCGPYVLFFTGHTIEAHPLSWSMPPIPSASPRPVLRRILSDQFLRVDVSSVQTGQYSSNQTYTVFALAYTMAHDPFLRAVIDLEDTPSLDIEYTGGLSAALSGFRKTRSSLDHIGMRGAWLEQKGCTRSWR